MWDLLCCKFHGYTNYGERLLETGDRPIEYHAPDAHWGTADGAGENRLGRMLMDLRDKLRTGQISFASDMIYESAN